MKYLYDEGKNFAKAFPRQAKYLNIDSVDDRDPYIERLFEGVAFLTAGIREKLDSTLPELTGGVVEVLWPGLRADFPSSTIVEFEAKGGVTSTMTLKNGSELISTAVGENPENYKFKTTQDIKLHPFNLTDISTTEQVDGKFKVVFKFRINANTETDKIEIEDFPLYIHGEQQDSLALHYFFITTKSRATVRWSDQERSIFQKKPVIPIGFSKEEALSKEFRDSLRSMNTLKEYFYYPEKFRFIAFKGLNTIPFVKDFPAMEFEYEILFDKKPPVGINISLEKFRLYCSPAINLFSDDSAVISDTGSKREHLLTPMTNSKSSRVHSIISVEGKDKESGAIIKYHPYYSYEDRSREALFHYNYRPSGNLGKDLYLTLIRPKFNDNKKIRQETVVAKVNCSNGVFPRDNIREGDISLPGRNFPDYATFKNITRPSQPATGIEDNKSLWVFQSMITSVFNSFGDIDRLKSFLKIFNNPENLVGATKIDSIEKAEVSINNEIVGSTALRGFLLTLTIKESSFSGTGDLNLFGIVLLNFIKGFVSINSFAKLKFNLYPSGKVLEFAPDRGEKWQI